MLLLRILQPEDETAFKAALAAFETDGDDMRFAFAYDPSVPFADYVKRVNGWPKGLDLEKKFVPNTFYVAVIDDKIIGRLSLRHELNEQLNHVGGHIGYCVIPEARGKGYATEMLRQGLLQAKAIGLDRVMISCGADNLASRRVIEKNGGVYDSDVMDGETLMRRYCFR